MASSSDSKANPITIPRGETPLPPYLARHLNIGFDADDVSALISSIDASQDRNSTNLPKLPAEILFHIIEYVPIDYVLQWRVVCRGFRDCIDGPVMFNRLRRAEVIGYLGASKTLAWAGLPEEAHEMLSHMCCRFEHLEDSPKALDQSEIHAKWGGTHAVFRIDDTWLEQMSSCIESMNDYERQRKWISLLYRLQLQSDAEPYGKIRWCMRLEHAVLDLDFPMEALRHKLIVDITSKRVMVEWKALLFRFIQTETQLRTIKEQKHDSTFTYSYEEDCLRETRRRRLRASLRENVPNHSLIRWGLNTLPSLFGKRDYHEPAEEFRHLRDAENSAMDFLMPLRKEAAMSKSERDRLWQLAKDHSDMVAALLNIENTYTEWKNTLTEGGSEPQQIGISRSRSSDPFTWSDKSRQRKEIQVLKWKAQQKNLQQVVSLLQESIEAVSVPDNAFDELGSDI